MEQSNRRLLHNMFSLYLIQGLNYLTPFLLYGFLNRTIGVSNFGLFMYAQSGLSLMIFFSDYGFNISALRKVSALSSTTQLSALFSTVLACKLLISAFIYLLLGVSYWLGILDFQLFMLLLLGALMVLGNIFTPLWLYQGLQKMGYLSLTSLISKLLPLALIILLVERPNQLFLVQFLICAGWFVSGILTWLWAMYVFKIKFILPSYRLLADEYKDGFKVFLAGSFGSFYAYGTTIILGWFVSYSVVGAYSVAERVAKGLVSLFQPFTQAMFPHLLNKLNLGQDVRDLIKKSMLLVSAFGFMACLSMAVAAPLIVKVLLGHVSNISVVSLYYWSVTAFFIIQSVFLGPVLYALKLDGQLLKIFAVCALLFVISDLGMTKYAGYQGSCLAIMLNEVLIFTAFGYLLVRKLLQQKTIPG